MNVVDGWPSSPGASEAALASLELFGLCETSQIEEMIFAVAEESQTRLDDSLSGSRISFRNS